MLCPNCQTQFQLVKVKSQNLGYFLYLDQCPNCGGIWFDQFELYQTAYQEAERIDKIDEELLRKDVNINLKLKCPHDLIELRRFKDINIPKNLQIFRCKKCSGVWVNQGELSAYKKFTKARDKNTEIDENFDEDLFSTSDVTFANLLINLSVPAPLSNYIAQNYRQSIPFILSHPAADLLKKLPTNLKEKAYQIFYEEHKKDIEDEEKTAGYISRIIEIAFTILRLLLGK